MAGRLFSLSHKVNKRSKNFYKKRRQRKSDRIRAHVDNRAVELERNLAESEKWFRSKYTKHADDEYNTPLYTKIPDVLNKRYKYVIEVDGSIHDNELARWNDRRKDEFYAKRGYKVFRVKAYCEDSYKKFFEEYSLYMNECKPRW